MHNYVFIGFLGVFSAADAMVGFVFMILLRRIFNSLGKFVEDANSERFMAEVLDQTVGIYGLGAGLLICTPLKTLLWRTWGEKYATKWRRMVFTSLILRDMTWFDKKTSFSGSLTLVTRSLEDLRNAMSVALPAALEAIIASVALLTLAFYHCWSLTLISLAGVPLIVIVNGLLGRLAIGELDYCSSLISTVSEIIRWTISSIETVKLFQAEPVQMNLIESKLCKLLSCYTRFYLYSNGQEGIAQSLVLMMFIQSFYFGSYLVRTVGTPVGDVMSVFWCSLSVISNFQAIGFQMDIIQKGLQAKKILSDLINDERDALESFKYSIGIFPSGKANRISFYGVDFKYPGSDKWALQNCTFNIAPNDFIYIVGRSGSGKSTLAVLICRLYAASNGSVLINGMPIDGLSLHWIRRWITIIDQSPSLFNLSIRENLILGGRKNPQIRIKNKDLEDAMASAYLGELINECQDGFNYMVGNAGTKLSGGQRQRMAIARGYLSNPSLLVLDEPFSALDEISKNKVLTHLRQGHTERTTVIITHDFSVIEDDDEVIVMSEGSVSERGTRKALERDSYSMFNELQRDTLPKFVASNTIENNSSHLSKVETTHDKLAKRTSIYNKLIGVNELQFLGIEKHEPKIEYELSSVDEISRKHMPIIRTTWRILLSVQDSGYLVMSLCFAGVNGILNPLFSFSFSHLIMGIVPGNTQATDALKWSMILLGISLADGLTVFLKVTLDVVCERWMNKVRLDALKSILLQSVDWFGQTSNSSSSISDLIINDIQSSGLILTKLLPTAITAIVLGIVSSAWSTVTGWKLSFAALSFLPVFYAGSILAAKAMSLGERQYKSPLSGINDLFSEVLLSIRTVKLYFLESYFSQKLKDKEKELLQASMYKAVYYGIASGISKMLTFVSQGVLLWYGMSLISTGEYKVQQALFVYALIAFALVKLDMLLGSLPHVSGGFGAYKALSNLIKLPPSDDYNGNDLGPHIFKHGSVEFKSVSFSYGFSHPVLKNLSFRVPAKGIVALRGPSGSGKSTIASLLTGLRRPGQGAIYIDDSPIKNISAKSLREQVALVKQMPLDFFEGTIYDNLFLGLHKMDQSSREARGLAELACKECGIHDFITQNLLNGYHTQLKSVSSTNGDGSSLSGGQLQRLGIARAILRKPKILVLDECTSALDPESTSHIKSFLIKHKLNRDMTVIIISHQKDMMDVADFIIDLP